VEPNKNYIKSVVELFNRLTIKQRMLIGGIIVGSIVFLIFIMFILNEPSYAVLYSNLSQEDASKVVEQLTAQKIPYKIEDNGQSIRIPKDKVYEMRLSLAGKGIPNSGVVGYEIFDKNTMGMSEFMQKLSYKRALEGELARTIMEQKGIEVARVHIVVPQKSVFKDEQKEPTASVVLKLSGNYDLTQGNVTAIANLVASSVEGLKPSKVTIVDSKGKLLSQNSEENSLGVITSKQYELKNNVENYLANKAQSLLDNVLGFGNAMVKVNVDLNFNQVEKQIESFDPESQVAISEQTNKSESSGKNLSDSNGVANENSITNYEVSKTLEKVIEGTGNIKRITVAAVINGITKEIKKGDKTEKVVEQRTDEQLQKLDQIIRQAVGIDQDRNDQVSVVCMPFESSNLEQTLEEEGSPLNKMDKWMNLVGIVAAIIAAMFVLKQLLNRLKNEKIIIGTVQTAGAPQFDLAIPQPVQTETKTKPLSSKNKRPALEVGDIEDEISDEAVNKKIKHEKIVNYVAQNPSEAAKLINLWLKEDEF